jgi:hypothetical protein
MRRGCGSGGMRAKYFVYIGSGAGDAVAMGEGTVMSFKPKRAGAVPEAADGTRLLDLARRCRELAEFTAVPDVTRELERIARTLEDEAGLHESDPV